MRTELRPLRIRAKLLLASEVVRTYVQARRLLRRHDLPATVACLRDVRAKSTDGVTVERSTGYRLARAVTRTLPLLPTDTRCLMRSLVLLGLLARRNIPATLVIGVKQGPDFAAHAWIEADGRALLASHETTFSRVVEL
jgi:hypothetical protein